MGESKVRSYYPLDCPFQFLIIVEDDTVYDVTVFTFQTINSIMLTYKQLLAQILPNGGEDNIVHAAVATDDEKLRKSDRSVWMIIVLLITITCLATNRL